jgi:hypothetical protein
MDTFLNKLSLSLTMISLTHLTIHSQAKFSTNQLKLGVLMSMKDVTLTTKVNKSQLKTFMLFFKVMLKQQEVKFSKVMKTQKFSYITQIMEHLVLLVCHLVIMFMLINSKLLSIICMITKCTSR